MGVIGLWSILDAGARPVRLEALAKKRLAVDASIWIYQFLKAVRDKEGNVLKNAHVVGFFRRICKLLFHGIQPVFVFDGKAPLLKKQTLRNRKVLREGGRVDVAKTAGKILAVQMRKRALEEAARQKDALIAVEEVVPENPVYFDELQLQPAEVQKQRFKKTDQYHLPDLDMDIDRAASANDPRIMTHEELQAYAKEFEGAEDMNLYDFSNIDYDSEMFMSLPHADQYSILNAARLRSRLRMGLSTEQLTDMFPDRMAFSKFQIERVKERSDLTNRLMNLNGMNDVGVQRVASERGREYVLIKNENVDGGWSLGVVNSAEKPIIIDKELQQTADSDDNDDMEFEDVPLGPDASSAEVHDLTGMSEEDMIKFALEESRKAQMSSTKPDPSFRPTERRTTNVTKHSASDRRTTAHSSAPLFVRDDSLQEPSGQRPSETVLGDEASPEESDRSTWEQEEAAELKKAMDMSLEIHSTVPEASSGGFIIEDDDDIQLPTSTVPGLMSAAADNQDTESSLRTDSRTPSSGFSLPFPKIDFSSSILAKQDKSKESGKSSQGDKASNNLPPTSLQKLQKAMQTAVEPEGTDVTPASESDFVTPPSRPQQFHEANSTIGSSETDQPEKRPVPSWFQEEVERPKELPKSAPVQPQEYKPDSVLANSGPELVDLTSDTSDDNEPGYHNDSQVGNIFPVIGKIIHEVSEPISITSHATSPQESTKDSAVPFDENSISSTQDPNPRDVLEPSIPLADSAPGSPDWDEAVSDSESKDPVTISDTQEIELDDSGNVPPILATEDSILDEADQTRLGEEEDMLARMAAEEDEYARFSAELGNKNASNYSDVEYEQDMKALKNQQKKNLRDADEVTQIMVLECQELLAQFGIPYITATSEAESQCAKLVQLGLVDGIVTDDSDVFLFGGTRVYRNMFNTAKTVECYVLSDLEREFDLDRNKLINLAHLLGSDYTDGIKKIGPVLALELIAEFSGPRGLDEFREYVDRVQSGKENETDTLSAFRKKFRKTAEKLVLPDVFPNPLVREAYINPEVDQDASNFEWGQPDVDALRGFLMRQCGWRQEYTDSQLLPVIKDMNVRRPRRVVLTRQTTNVAVKTPGRNATKPDRLFHRQHRCRCGRLAQGCKVYEDAQCPDLAARRTGRQRPGRQDDSHATTKEGCQV